VAHPSKQTSADPTVRVLDELGRVVRQLTRISGGPGDGPALTGTQRLALFELLEEGPLRLNDLAGLMGASPPTASRAVDALVDAGLVERRPDPADRRAVRVDLTSDGRELVERRKAHVAESFAPAAAAMPAAERRQLATLLGRLADELAR
jgi:DNA-binding MarR family transcriptional regulator